MRKLISTIILQYPPIMISTQPTHRCLTQAIALSVALIFVHGLCRLHAETSQEDSKPNIVLILADDMGIHDLGCYGRNDHNTPNLDRLASQGIRYTSAYCGLSICSASRAALMTGKYPSRLHITTFLPGRADADTQLLLHPRVQSFLPSDEFTVAEMLKSAGYRTGHFGKWHLGGGGPTKHGFDVAMEPNGKGSLDDKEGGKNEYKIVNSAIEFLKASNDKPAFCYVPHHSPHIPLAAPADLVEKNRSAFNPLYAATMESLDIATGKLLEAIDQLRRPTIVIFSSDNGGLHVPEIHAEPVTYNKPFRAGKGYLYEGGVRIPLIVRWTNQIQPGQVYNEPVSLMDVMPTLLEIAGVNPAKSVGPMDGKSQKTSWMTNTPPTDAKDRAFYWHFPHYTNQGSRPASAMRQGKWKLIEYLDDPKVELYDLESDISESKDLAEMQKDTVVSMRDSLHRWRSATGAQVGNANPNANRELFSQVYLAKDPSKLEASAGAIQTGEAWKAWRTAMNNAIAGKKPILKNTNEIILAAKDAHPHGSKLRYEPETYKNVLGYWTDASDWADWEVQIPKSGQYEVEVHYGCGVKNGGSRASIEAGESKLEWTVRDTGHFQNIIIESIGTLDLKSGAMRLAVKPISKVGVAVMDIRRIVLRPVE